MSDTVKFIIEIHKAPKNDHERWVLANGTPLDDVKTEIEEKISHYDHFQGSNTAHGLEIALEIIDKHISGKEKE